jgi:signal transduction histidine kinase
MLYPWRFSGWSGLLMLLVPLSAGLLAQGYRYARVSNMRQRQQTKWVVFGGILATIGLGLQLAIEVVGDRDSTAAVVRDQLLIRPVGQILMCLLPVSIAIALFRYRLWDIDLILHRAMVYGLLTTTIAGVDAMVVSGLGAALPLEGSPVGSLLAAGLVAVLFQPLRVWFQRAATRLLYGDRDDPYAVMSRLNRQLSATLAQDSVLPTVVKSVRDALKLPYAAIALGEDGEHILAASGEPLSPQLTLPLQHRGELVGALRVSPRGPGEGWSSGDRRLLEDLARQAGSAVHAVRLTTDLQRLSDELQQAREQLVLTREEERRRLRRDLHDELAPSLAALGLTAAAARDLLKTESTAAVRLLEDLHAGLRLAVGDIRRIAYELRPPVLDELGLVAAIRERAARLEGASGGAASGAPEPVLHIVVEAPDQLPSLAAAVEVATYRIVQEALMNVVRHARATRCVVRLSLSEGLDIEVVDNGIGQAANARPGIGLRSMRERAQELGGQLTIEPASPSGTHLRVHLPLRKEPPNGLAASPDRG